MWGMLQGHDLKSEKMYAEEDQGSSNPNEIVKSQDIDETTSNDSTSVVKLGNHDVSNMLNNESDYSSDQESDYETGTTTENKFAPPNALSCPYCHKLFHRPQDLEKHTRMHTGEKPFKCDICDKYFSQKSHRNHHMKVHLGIKSHFCDFCDKGFWRKGELTLHRISDHEDRFTSTEMDEYKKSAGILSCYVCNRSFLRQKDLEKHERVHTGDKPFKCDVCDQFFAQSGQLSLHMKRHLGLKPYPCDICGKAFLQKYLMVVHKRIHTKEKPFSCDVCGMSFYENCKMQVHKRRHTEQPTLACEFCEKAFYDKQVLESHRRNHTGERPFACNLCGVTFKQSNALRKHMKAHETRKNSFSCDLCDKVFIKHTHYAEHKQKDHFVPIIFSCPICKQVFSDKDKLTLHQNIHAQQKKSDENGDTNNVKEMMEVKDENEIVRVKDEPVENSDNSDFEPHVTIECNPNEGWEDDVKDTELTKAVRRVVSSSLDKDVEAKVEPKEEANDNEEMNTSEFASFLEVSIHSRKPKNNDPVVCLDCGKSFVNKRNLKVHQKTVHATNKPFSCELCPKSFATAYQLQKHTELHTKEAKFPCDLCGRCFTVRSYLKRHLETHLPGNPFVCGLCGNSFRRKDRLDKHKKLLHPEMISLNGFQKDFNLLSCNVCDVMFADTETLDAHKLSHTNDKGIKEEAIENEFTEPSQTQLKEELSTEDPDFRFMS